MSGNANRLTRGRLPWLGRAPEGPPTRLEGEVVLRLSRAADGEALERLAALDSQPPPRGSFVIALADGELVAAVPLDEPGSALADPFRPTASLVSLAAQRARDLRATGRGAQGSAHRRLARA